MPENLFYNDAVPRAVSLQKEWIQFRSQSFDSNVFNYCSYPFLIHEFHKLNLLRFEFKNLQDIQVCISVFVGQFDGEIIVLIDFSCRWRCRTATCPSRSICETA